MNDKSQTKTQLMIAKINKTSDTASRILFFSLKKLRFLLELTFSSR